MCAPVWGSERKRVFVYESAMAQFGHTLGLFGGSGFRGGSVLCAALPAGGGEGVSRGRHWGGAGIEHLGGRGGEGVSQSIGSTRATPTVFCFVY